MNWIITLVNMNDEVQVLGPYGSAVDAQAEMNRLIDLDESATIDIGKSYIEES